MGMRGRCVAEVGMAVMRRGLKGNQCCVNTRGFNAGMQAVGGPGLLVADASELAAVAPAAQERLIGRVVVTREHEGGGVLRQREIEDVPRDEIAAGA